MIFDFSHLCVFVCRYPKAWWQCCRCCSCHSSSPCSNWALQHWPRWWCFLLVLQRRHWRNSRDQWQVDTPLSLMLHLFLQNSYPSLSLCTQWPNSSRLDSGLHGKSWLLYRISSLCVWCFECYGTRCRCMLVWHQRVIWKPKGWPVCVSSLFTSIFLLVDHLF